MRLRVEIINTRQFINYNKALRLVEKGYAAFVGDDRRKIRYLEDYEQMLLRADMRNAERDLYPQQPLRWRSQPFAPAQPEQSHHATHDGVDLHELHHRGGTISGEWQSAHSGRKPMSGGPQSKTMQFRMKVR